ncbi:hypothetical protein VTN96DRAFT_328 [Rasamsonia emersonii]
MGWFSDDSAEAKAYNEWDQAPHKAELSHELIAGAAAFEAAKAWEKHQEKEGKPENHALAKEIIAGLAGAAVDRLVETKGLDYLDREKAKHHAKERLEEQLASEY